MHTGATTATAPLINVSTARDRLLEQGRDLFRTSCAGTAALTRRFGDLVAEEPARQPLTRSFPSMCCWLEIVGGQASRSLVSFSSENGHPIYPSDMARATSATRPLVSVVTPFYNTAPYLAECIESVLAQSYSHFEYILMDNCSTDGSSEIAAAYASRDARIRLITSTQFLRQIPNYNRALAQISFDSMYCKIVEADNHIFPDCLHFMVQAFEQSETIGLVSSYWLMGNLLYGSGYPYPMPTAPGRDWAKQDLLGSVHVFGSPTQVMFRSSIVRCQQPFYDQGALHADTDKCYQILQSWELGFVHQVLSFSRTDNESITSTARELQAGSLDRYIMQRRYAPVFLEASDAASVRREAKRAYYRALARRALLIRGRRAEFWRYHKVGLETLSEGLDWLYLVSIMGQELLWLISNPGMTTVRALNRWKQRGRPRAAVQSGARRASIWSIQQARH
jgi:glycosyltransferase involved in cell wall biosynthesis